MKSILSAISLIFLILANSCSGQTEQQALESLRAMTRGGGLPPESAVAQIESKFAGKQAGALAKLLRARIRFENKDFAGAAAILDTDAIARQTALEDYALWLRGRALAEAGNHPAAMLVFSSLIERYPDSIRVRDARLRWAASAAAAGEGLRVAPALADLLAEKDAAAIFAAARAYESMGDTANAAEFYRRAYFYGAGTQTAVDAEAKLKAFGVAPEAKNADELVERAVRLADAGDRANAEAAFSMLSQRYPESFTPQLRLKQLTTLAALKKMTDAENAFAAIPRDAPVREEAFYQLIRGYSAAKLFAEARRVAAEMLKSYPGGRLTPKALVEAGMAARDAKSKSDEQYFLSTALAAFPNAVEVASAQFEMAWLEHENGNYGQSSQMFIEHLARYVDRDTSNRGKAGYWAARDSERAGKIAEACFLYDAVIYRYNANWYGYLAAWRKSGLDAAGKCNVREPADAMIRRAAENLKKVTVARETSGEREALRMTRSDQLGIIGLFDWAIDELNEARSSAGNSPKVSLALARLYRLKGDNVNAFLSLARSFPDYSQMFPEEMTREEWEIFYPLTNWEEIRFWAEKRNLDPYTVAGLIRQESVFNPRARSSANAFGLMQLLVPTARTMAKKYVSTTSLITPETLYNPQLNIELGTAYMREQLDKFGRIEYMSAAYNAGPGRIPQWRATLPIEIDEFVEAIPFKETRGYVQGVIRNSAQYRRLYDENGRFRPNVGARPLRGEMENMPPAEFSQAFPDVSVE
ncbi:MAG: transglycosylase SLT domain-containing protein [Pyrinomonadaceae bacterium]